MMIKNFPRPIADETFNSWIFRCSHHKSCSTISDDDLFEIPSPWRLEYEKGASDFDFYCELSIASKVMKATCLSESALEQLFGRGSRFSLSSTFANAFCPTCLVEDVKARGLPSWRKSWCYVDVAYCLKHKRLLCGIDAKLDESKAWVAYAMKNPIESASDDGLIEKPAKFQLSSGAVRNHLGMKAQRWISGLYSKDIVKVKGTDYSIAGREAARCARALMSLFLKKKTYHYGAGIARWYFCNSRHEWDGRHLSFMEALTAGLRESTPFQRMVALIFTAWVSGVYSQGEIEAFVRFCRKQGYCWPTSVDELARETFSLSTHTEYMQYVELFTKGVAPEPAISFVDNFMSAMHKNVINISLTPTAYPDEWHKSVRKNIR